MSELIFQKDSYIKEFECKIIGVDEEKKFVVLDRTAFYSGGGGQPCDIGVLKTDTNTYVVTKVKKRENKVCHSLYRWKSP